MRTEAVKRNHKARYVKDVSDKNPLAIERDDSQSTAQNGKVGIVSHPNLEVGDGFVRDKGSFVGEHVWSVAPESAMVNLLPGPGMINFAAMVVISNKRCLDKGIDRVDMTEAKGR